MRRRLQSGRRVPCREKPGQHQTTGHAHRTLKTSGRSKSRRCQGSARRMSTLDLGNNGIGAEGARSLSQQQGLGAMGNHKQVLGVLSAPREKHIRT